MRTIVGNRSRLDLVRRKVAVWDDGKQWRLRLRVSDTNRLRFTVSARNAKSLMGQSPLPKKSHRSIAGNEKFLLPHAYDPLPTIPRAARRSLRSFATRPS
jgi:hypothetical protein